MSPSPVEYLRHMLDEAEYLLQVGWDLDRTQLDQDETLKRAVVRSIEVIGEAAKKVPDSFRQACDQIDCRAIGGMRDRLIHNYFGIDYDIVLEVIVRKVPELKGHLEVMIQQETEKGE